MLLITRPAQVPPLFFDEGWNLSVARNWVELGRYCLLLNGRPIPATGLSTGFPTIIPLALSFRMFGIGILQARLPGIFFTVGALTLMCFIAYRLFGRQVATGTLAVLLLMPISPELHPVLVGRQALGEMPAIFYLLAGYACVLARGRGRTWLLPLTPVWWGLALMSKAQVIPFLGLALLLPLLAAVFKRSWKAAAMVSAGLLGSFIVFGVLIWFQKSLLHDPMPPQIHVSSWSSSIMVPVAYRRIATLKASLVLFPAWIGLFYAAWKLKGSYKRETLATKTGFVHLSLLVLSASWFAWYAMLSIGWLRYLFPAMFLSSVFTASMLHSFTTGFRVRQTMRNAASVVLNFRFRRQTLAALFAVVVILWAVPLTALLLYQPYTSDEGKGPMDVLAFLNAHTPKTALLECSEAELFFLLNRRYNYGSLDVSRLLSQRLSTDEKVMASDDRLEADPDYLVVGPTARWFGLYGAAQNSSDYRLLQHFDRYDVYERIREGR